MDFLGFPVRLGGQDREKFQLMLPQKTKANKASKLGASKIGRGFLLAECAGSGGIMGGDKNAEI